MPFSKQHQAIHQPMENYIYDGVKTPWQPTCILNYSFYYEKQTREKRCGNENNGRNACWIWSVGAGHERIARAVQSGRQRQGK